MLDDFFDKDKDQSREIFEYMDSLFTNHADIIDVLVNYVNTGKTDSRVILAWNLLSDYDITIEQQCSIICSCQVKNIRNQAWNMFVNEINNKKNDPSIMKLLINLFNDCSDKELEFDCWNLLWELNFFEEETGLELVLTNELPKIVEYAWKRIDYEKLPTERLLQIAMDTSSEKIAKEALILYRKKI